MKEMNNIDMAHELSELAQLNINAVYSFDRAIDSTELIFLRDQLGDFRERHYHRALDIGKLITALGVMPPEYTTDFKGMLMEGFTAISGGIGVESAIRAMLRNEEHIMKKYRECYALPLSENIKKVVELQYRDIQSTVEILQKILTNRVWEKAA